MKALLLDTGFSAAPILRALKREGLEVVTLGRDARDDLVPESDSYIEGDYADVSCVVQAFLDLEADIIVPGCTDVSYLSASRAAAELKLSGYDDPAVVAILHSKHHFRDLCRELGVPSPQVYPQMTAALDSGKPLIVKPVDSFSGRGVTVLKDPDLESCERAVLMAKAASATQTVILEDYIEGQLYSHSAFLHHGRVVVHFSVMEFGFESEFTVDTSFLGSDQYAAQLNDMVERIARRVNISSGLIHLQYLLRDQEIFIIELARRCPGDLYAELIRRSTGYDYARAYVSCFLGQTPASGPIGKDSLHIRRTIKCDDAQLAIEMDLLGGVRSLAYYPIRRPKRIGDDRAAIAILQVEDVPARDTIVSALAKSTP